MAEIPAADYSHIHRSMSIDQLRLMNDRGHLMGDLRGALHDYKNFGLGTVTGGGGGNNSSELRSPPPPTTTTTASAHHHDRMDYASKGMEMRLHEDANSINNNNNNNSPTHVELRHQHQHQQHQHQQMQQQQQQQHQQEQHDVKPYSSPPTPPTPHSIVDGQLDTKLFAKSELQMHQQLSVGGANNNNNNINNSNAGGGGHLHMREAKPYKCTQCTKTFANSSYLSQHTRIHLGIKPYRCEVCHRKFTQLSHLQQHIRTHTGDKPYKCRHTGCQKAFSQLSNLQSHSRSHQTDKPFKCNSCYKCFVDETSLLEHIPKHKESKHLKTHICQYCGKSYTQETYLTKHMQKHAERADKRPPIAIASMNRATLNNPTGAAVVPPTNTVHNGPLSVGTVDQPYWPKVSPDSAANLAEAMQQHQQNQYDFAMGQNTSGDHLQHRVLMEHHRSLNGSVDESGSVGSNNHGSTGEDLVIARQNVSNLAQHLVGQNTSVSTAPITSSASINSYDPTSLAKSTAQSAFTPINVMPSHLNSIGHHPMAQRPYLPYDFPSKNAQQNPPNSFSNQLISLHQIRNYAHQPVGGGLLSSDHHLFGIGVGGKDKVQ